MIKKSHTPLDITQAVSGPKEADLPRPKEASNIQEVIEHEKIDEEVKPHIEIRKETIRLPEDLKKIGLQEISNSKFKDYQNVKTPLSDDKVMDGLHAPITSGWRWLATFCLLLLKKAHLSLKKVHGKVVRVISG